MDEAVPVQFGGDVAAAVHIEVRERMFLSVGIAAVVVEALHSLIGELNALGLSPPEPEHNRAHYPDNHAGPHHAQDRYRPEPPRVLCRLFCVFRHLVVRVL